LVGWLLVMAVMAGPVAYESSTSLSEELKLCLLLNYTHTSYLN